MTLLLIRHGETELNVARTLQPAATPLGARGLRQAEALAARLATGSPRLAAIVTSDLPRALQTAEAIARATGAAIERSPLWRERDFGDWRGRPYDALTVDPLTMADAPPGGESAATFEARVARAFAHACDRHAALVATTDAALAIVTHGLVLRVLLARHLTLPPGSDAPAHLGNTALSVVDAAPPHRVRLVACTAHLDGLAVDDARALSGG